MKLQCPNCGKVMTEDELGCDLYEVPDLLQRIEPGETVPYGECPDCGALVHEYKEGSEMSLYVVLHAHRHGSDYRLVCASQVPTVEQVVAQLGLDYDPNSDCETIQIVRYDEKDIPTINTEE